MPMLGYFELPALFVRRLKRHLKKGLVYSVHSRLGNHELIVLRNEFIV